MVFYCPNCQKEYEAEPRETITTLQGRVAYKAACPVCHQDMAEFVPGEKTTPPAAPAEAPPAQPEPVTDQAPSPTADPGAAAPPSSDEQTPEQVLAQAGVGEAVPAIPETPLMTEVETGEPDTDFQAAQAALNEASSDLASAPAVPVPEAVKPDIDLAETAG